MEGFPFQSIFIHLEGFSFQILKHENGRISLPNSLLMEYEGFAKNHMTVLTLAYWVIFHVFVVY